MKMIGDHGLEFESTGLTRYCYAQLVSIKKEGNGFYLGYGYDGTLDYPEINNDQDDEHRTFNQAERAELAMYMIALWQEYGGLDQA